MFYKKQEPDWYCTSLQARTQNINNFYIIKGKDLEFRPNFIMKII